MGLEGSSLDAGKSSVPAMWDHLHTRIYAVREGRIEYANPAMNKWLACNPDEIAGRLPVTLIHPDDRDAYEEQQERLSSGEVKTGRLEIRIMRDDGSIRAVTLLETRLSCENGTVVVGEVADRWDTGGPDSSLSEHFRFERVLADLSASFINLPCEQVDPKIDSSLESLVEFLGYDRCSIIEFGEDEAHFRVTHSYAVPGCARFPIGPVAEVEMPWLIKRFRSGRCIDVRDVQQELPAEATEERKHCRTHGIQSLVTVPLSADGRLFGGVSFAFLQKRCALPTEIVFRMQLIGEVFANALLRRQKELALRGALAEIENLRQKLSQENLCLREQIVLKQHHGRIIGRSDAIMRVLANAERVAATSSPVLLTGETGTGKELLAQTIHELSDRHRKPLVTVNCASLPATLIESELFGRTAGAYTGAASAQVGRFELANGSTLFLDEIGELPLELQAKLLRVLQDGRFERLGCPKTISVDTRIIAATNRQLDEAVRAGEFRADLFHRLNVFPIQMPPLRERREDIPSLTWAFVEALGKRMGRSIKSISQDTMQKLQQHDWPGNIRELSNAIERAMILTSGDTLQLEFSSSADATNVASQRQMTLKESERDRILEVLQQTGWRIRGTGGAAQVLDIKPTTLEARMAKLGIRRPPRHSEIQPSRQG